MLPIVITNAVTLIAFLFLSGKSSVVDPKTFIAVLIILGVLLIAHIRKYINYVTLVTFYQDELVFKRAFTKEDKYSYKKLIGGLTKDHLKIYKKNKFVPIQIVSIRHKPGKGKGSNVGTEDIMAIENNPDIHLKFSDHQRLEKRAYDDYDDDDGGLMILVFDFLLYIFRK